jgi:preprotein translocase subunit SecG
MTPILYKVDLMYQIILVIHILLSLSIIGLVLIQRGKGAEMGAGFGGGASQTLFGSGGSGSFLTRSTAILATLFFISCLALSYVAVHMGQGPADYLPEVPAETAGIIPAETPAATVPAIPPSTEQAPVSDLPAVPNLQQDTEASEPAILTPAPAGQ